MSFTLLYSVVFHLMFESVHSCDIPALSFSVSALEMTGLIDNMTLCQQLMIAIIVCIQRTPAVIRAAINEAESNKE